MMMAAVAGEGSAVLGIERDARQLAAARKLTGPPGQGGARVEFREGDATDLRLGSDEWGNFDLAHSRFLLEHLPEPAAAVRRMARALRPGGRLFLSDDDHEVFRVTPEPDGFRELWKAYMRSYEAAGNDPYVGRHLVKHLRDAGMVSVKNGGLFFGASADEPHFGLIADNLIAILEGANDAMTGSGLIDGDAYVRSMEALRAWKVHPAASQWYMVCWAEGTVPASSSRPLPPRSA